MKKTTLLFTFFILVLAEMAFAIDLEPGNDYFLRSTLHAVRGDEIYWVNYMDNAKTTLIKAGEKVKISSISGHIIRFDYNGKTYNFAFTEKGNKGTGDIYDKFFTDKDINTVISKYTEDVQSKIRRGIAEKGMTKEQMLFAIGCPAVIDNQKTFNLTLKEIMSSDKWIYYYNRFNRWLAEFNKDILVDIKN